jgi:HSP20 family molecular chaperone IbpA
MGQSKKYLIPVISALVGALFVFTLVKVKPQWFINNSVIEQQLTTSPLRENEAMAKNFDSLFSDDDDFQEVDTPDDLETREDDNFIYYEIAIPNIDATSLKTTLEKGYVTITGTSEKKSEEGNVHQYSSSTFEKIYPLPAGTVAEKMEMIPDKNKVTLKFPKKKS